MSSMSIGQAARQARVKPSTLRFYEEIGVMPRAQRVNGRRRYGPDAIERVQVARFAQSVGFTLAQIRDLFRLGGGRPVLHKRWKPVAREKIRELDAIIAKAQQMKAALSFGLECGCIRIEDCLPGARSRTKA
jgi:MerR family redox-sensitive transcriptional activator SoxR